jgi:hypothetical protein
MIAANGQARGGPPRPSWLAAIIRVVAPVGPRVSDRGGRHAPGVLGGPLPVAAPAWPHTEDLPGAACGALGRPHRGRARSWVTAAPEAADLPCPRAAQALFIPRVPCAACVAKVEFKGRG